MRTVWIMLVLLLAACGPEATPVPPGSQPTGGTPAATPSAVNTPSARVVQAEQAIALAQQNFPELRQIKTSPPNTIGASSNIWALDGTDGWNVVFWQGDGDCPAGCINNHYWYVSVTRSGDATLVGEYTRNFNASANAMEVRGQPLWGIPKQ
jgi:hypothetical protein